MKVNQTTVTHPRLNPVQLPLVGKWWSNNAATRIFLSCAMMTGISSTRSWVAVIFWLIPRAYLTSYFLAIIHAKRKQGLKLSEKEVVYLAPAYVGHKSTGVQRMCSR